MDDGGLCFRKDGNEPGLGTREQADSLQELQPQVLCAQGLPAEVQSGAQSPSTAGALQTTGEQSLMLLPLPRTHMGQAEGFVEPSQTLPSARDWPSSSNHGTNNSRAPGLGPAQPLPLPGSQGKVPWI